MSPRVGRAPGSVLRRTGTVGTGGTRTEQTGTEQTGTEEDTPWPTSP